MLCTVHVWTPTCVHVRLILITRACVQCTERAHQGLHAEHCVPWCSQTRVYAWVCDFSQDSARTALCIVRVCGSVHVWECACVGVCVCGSVRVWDCA